MSRLSASRSVTKTQGSDVQRTAAWKSSPVASSRVFPTVHRLQRAVGNRGMTRLLRSGVIQAKLTVGPPDDEYEREADRVADRIMRMTDDTLPQLKNSSSMLLQRKCTCVGNASDCDGCKAKEVPRLQRTASGGSGLADVPSIVHEVLRSPGHALDSKTLAFMEPRFSHDFRRVRAHTDARASTSAKAVNALAFTVGNDIVFSTGQYDPTSSRGRQLMAHELTHVVQQSSSLRIHRSITDGLLQRVAVHDGRILDEGSCADLVAGSKWICCDPDNGMERKGKKKDIDGNECPGEKFTPIFTCENNCAKALEKGCDDTDNWMALPKSRFERRKCAQDLVICGNGTFTHAYVRDKSEREAWEVSKAVPAALGISPDFKGVVYGDETDADFKKDKRCGNAPPPPPTPKRGGKGSSKDKGE